MRDLSPVLWFSLRLAVSGQDHHRHPAAARVGQATHDEGEVVERERLSGGGQ